ncbi:MAG: Na+/H+ antiporter NhaA [Sphingomonadaceae bacterium]|nr:Na+/H+ antiporter NhaA [Sphingomonadaceae bacterium]
MASVPDDESSGKQTAITGLLLAAATLGALIIANSAAAPLYHALLARPVAGLATLAWINDGLMALFFLLVGLEIKRELLIGALSTPASRLLPGAAAFAGMVVPALCYVALTSGDASARHGWAIPAATDIAFALAVVAALGRRVPPALRVFLTAVAVIDDLGAIIVIGVFYTASIHVALLAAAVAGIGVLVVFNRAGVRSLAPYLLVGAGVWAAVHESGVHATLAGVAVALTIPLGNRARHRGPTPLDRLEHALAPIVGFIVVPVFGFANAGIAVDRAALTTVAAPIPMAIVVALVVGKQAGVFGAVWGLAKARLAVPPAGTTWRQVHGAALLCGIGFTMSLFIAALAFGAGSANDTMAKLGILIGSLISALAGYVVLRTAR